MPNHTQTNSSRRIKNLPLFNNQAELSSFLENNFTDSLKQLIRLTIKTMIKEEMKNFREEFDEKLYFNGHYHRNMIGSVGEIKGVPIPRFRQKPKGFSPACLSVFDCEQDKFIRLIEQMHLLGISQRKIKKLAHDCLGINISTARVGAIHRELAQAEEAKINYSPIGDEYEYLLLDGLWTKTRGYGFENDKAVLLCVLGVRADGKRKILGFGVTRDESYQSWRGLLLNLKKRGLNSSSLKLIISDGGGGLKKAIKHLFPQTPLQSCIVHKLRNVLKSVARKHKKQLANDAKTIFNQETKEAAIKQAKMFCRKWYLSQPSATATLKDNLNDYLTFYRFKKEVWTKIRTTNILEREFREVRRRIKVFDSSFNNTISQSNYAASIINYLNHNYPTRTSLHTNT